MPNIFNRFLKVTVVSLLIAITALFLLFINFYNILIQNQKYTAEIIYKEISVSRIMQMNHKHIPFQTLINHFNKSTDINIEILSFLHQKSEFLKYLQKIDGKSGFWELKNNNFILYKPIKSQQSCMKCHTYSSARPQKIPLMNKINHEKILGVMKIEMPIKKVEKQYFKIIIIVLAILFGALVFTLSSYMKNMQYIRKNIGVLNSFFEKNISKGKYKLVNAKMYFEEFENLKNKINYAIQKIIFYRQKMLDRFYYNRLTELPNRFKLEEDIKTIKKPLVILNINDFKIINDTFGFDIGNLLIYEVAKELKKQKQKIYHLSVDEFAFFLDTTDAEENRIFVKNFMDNIRKNYKINHHELTISFRCGISYKENYILTADMATDFAKKKRKECVFYRDIENEVSKMQQNIDMLTKISNAIEKDLFIIYYQPIVDNKTGKIFKYESLVRMKDEKGIIYSPDKFLELSKKANVYPKITRIIIDKVCKKLFQKQFNVSINLDSLDFEDKETKQFILKKLKRPHFKKNISFELLENEDLTNNKDVLNFVKFLKGKGVTFLIDDFGSGFSNFANIFRFNIDGIKIDGSLIKDILTDKMAYDLVASINEFAKKRNIATIAEYVANKEIYECVKKIGIDYSQGYYFSPPKPLI